MKKELDLYYFNIYGTKIVKEKVKVKYNKKYDEYVYKRKIIFEDIHLGSILPEDIAKHFEWGNYLLFVDPKKNFGFNDYVEKINNSIQTQIKTLEYLEKGFKNNKIRFQDFTYGDRGLVICVNNKYCLKKED